MIVSSVLKKGAKLTAKGWLCLDGGKVSCSTKETCCCCTPATKRSFQLAKLIMMLGSELAPEVPPEEKSLTMSEDDSAEDAEYKLNYILGAVLNAIEYRVDSSSDTTKILYELSHEDWEKLIPSSPALLTENDPESAPEESENLKEKDEGECSDNVVPAQPRGDKTPLKEDAENNTMDVFSIFL